VHAVLGQINANGGDRFFAKRVHGFFLRFFHGSSLPSSVNNRVVLKLRISNY
jgi:hypothetical protein